MRGSCGFHIRIEVTHSPGAITESERMALGRALEKHDSADLSCTVSAGHDGLLILRANLLAANLLDAMTTVNTVFDDALGDTGLSDRLDPGSRRLRVQPGNFLADGAPPAR